MKNNSYRSNNNLLIKVKKNVNWKPIEDLLKQLKKNKSSAGVKSYLPIKMFKILLLQTWYNFSDRAIEEFLSDSISFRIFVGFNIEEKTPNHTTICRFRNNLFKKRLTEEIFKIINSQLETAGLIKKRFNN